MKNFFILVLLLFPFLMHAQIKSGEVIYKVKPPPTIKNYVDTTLSKNTPEVNMYFERMYNEIVKTTPHLEFKFDFDENHAYFNYPSIVGVDHNININQVITSTGVYGDIYTNKKENLKIEERLSNIYHKPIRIQSKFNEWDWQIESDTKTIAGYECRKASIIVFKDTINHREFKVTAWFAPDIPFQFGPLGYGFLPGLILGLENSNGFYFYADRIKLQQTTKKIKMPAKGQLIDKATYDKEVKKYSQELRRRHGDG